MSEAETTAETTVENETAAPTLPDRLSIDPRSPHFDGDVLQRGIGVRFKGVEKFNVEEYCISEGWIRVPAGRSLDRHGRPLTIKLTGEVEVWIKG